jgi:hypothetical protein
LEPILYTWLKKEFQSLKSGEFCAFFAQESFCMSCIGLLFFLGLWPSGKIHPRNPKKKHHSQVTKDEHTWVNIPQNIGPNENYINFSLCLFLRGRAKQVNQPLILSSINDQDQEASLLERVSSAKCAEMNYEIKEI